MWKALLLTAHPLLLATFPILHLYNSNSKLLTLDALFTTLLISVIVTLFLFLIIRQIFHDNLWGALVSSCLVVLFFSYGQVFSVLQSSLSVTHYHLLPIWLALLVAVLFLVGRRDRLSGRNMEIISQNLSIVAGVLVAFSSVGIVAGELGEQTLQAETLVTTATAPVSELPDIYYIILDAYDRNDVLLERYGFDNSEFTAWLTDRGFYVATESGANYPFTFLSLSSSLNMQYLDFLEAAPDNLETVYQMIEDNQVLRTLKSLGYSYVHFATGYEPTHTSEFADVYFDYTSDKDSAASLSRGLSISNFQFMVLRTTLLEPLISVRVAMDYRFSTLYNFDKLPQVAAFNEPTFAFAHVLVPRPGFVFQPDDAPAPPDGISVDGQVIDPERYTIADAYIQQLIYANRSVQHIIDEILAQSTITPIIILQSDHGFGLLHKQREALGWSDDEYVRARVPILNAYLVPDAVQNALYPSISPVNSFRVLFDNFFSTDLGLLEDRNYFAGRNWPRDFREVTDLVSADLE